MATTRIYWVSEEGYDTHLLWGDTSPRLDEVLRLDQDTAGIPPLASDSPRPSDVASVKFMPRFAGTLSGNSYTGHGLIVNTTNGVVTFQANPPVGSRLRSFIMVATVTLNTPDPANPTVFRAEWRFHIHDSIAKLWLTPKQLTIHQNSQLIAGPKLTVLAQFDDGMMGDITKRSDLSWTSSQPNQITVIRDGTLKALQSNGAATIQVVKGVVPFPHLMSEAIVKSLPPWGKYAETSVQLRYIPGSGPGPSKVNEATNILFLSEGFKKEEKNDFEAIVNGIVYNTRTYRTFRPLSYDLADSINYWMAFVPSPEAGVSVQPLCVAFVENSALMKANDLNETMPQRPLPGTNRWSLANLFYEVGYPVPKDDADLINEPENQISKLNEWKAFYGKDSNGEEFTEDRVRNVYKAWKGLAKTRISGVEKDARFLLLNEKDSGFGFGMGERPRLEQTNVFPSETSRDPLTLAFQHRRITRRDFEDFLSHLRHGTTTIGDRWASGKDRRMVVIIARIERGRAANNDRNGYIFLEIEKKISHTCKATSDGYDLVPVNLGITKKSGWIHQASLVLFHELAHSLGLGDEYGEFDAPSSPAEEHELEEQAKFFGNVQPESELRSSTAGVRLDSAKVKDHLKWFWPRIEQAGTLLSAPLAPGQTNPAPAAFVSGQVFKFKLYPGQAKVFKKDDIVLLRKRPVYEEDKPSPWLTVEGDPVGDMVEARVFVDTTRIPTIPDSGHYPANSLLYKPVLPPGKPIHVPTGLHFVLHLIAPTIHRHIITTRGPLDTPLENPQRACDPAQNKARDKKSPYIIPTNLPANLIDNLPPKAHEKLSKQKYLIIGLYESGQQYYCGGFHPGGVCLMSDDRRHHRSMTRFCQVCRYVLVDLINPTKHGAIDQLYADEYAEPLP